MPLADPASFCIEIDPLSGFDATLGLGDMSQFTISFPGGAVLSAAGALPQDALEALFGQVNTALAPLQPVFNVVDALLLAAKVLDRLKSGDLLGAAKQFINFGKAIDKLKSLVPQVSVPVLIRDTIDALIAFLLLVKAQLNAIANAQLRVLAAATRAAELSSPDLLIVVDCATSQVNAQLVGLQSTAAPLNRTIAVLNLLCGIADLPELPSLDMSGDVDASLGSIDSLVASLTAVRAAIP